jgi:2-methylcitrate dehydratase PrpD
LSRRFNILITQVISKHLVDTTYNNLSSETIEATKKSILDILGVMIPPTTLVKTCISVYELVKEAGGNPECTIIGFGGKAPCWEAAFVNGSLCHAIDFDDCVGLEKPLMHPTGSSFPAALAMSERVGNVSGKEFITAVALGNDLCVRMAACLKGNVIFGYPFFPITTFGVFSSAAVSAKILKLSESQMINTLGLALNRVSGVTKGLFGSDLRAIRDGINGKEGVLCALLAWKGMDACRDAIELLFNLYYHDDINPEFLTAYLGKTFRGSEVGFKPWPSCQGTHSYIQGVLKIVNENNIKPEQIEEITLYGNSEGQSLCLPYEIKQKPTTSITAKVALPFAVSVAIVHKSVAISNFLPENLNDTKALELAKKVKFVLEAERGSYSSREEIKTKDGKIYKTNVDVLRGSIENPLSTEELITKFKDCARYARKPLATDKMDKLIDSILNLEKISNMSEITRLLG